MPDIIKIKQGLDINLKGTAELYVQSIEPELFAIKPTDFIGVIPKLHVQEGDEVKAGTVLFHDKKHEEIVFTSPVSGKVKEIRRGAKRLLEAVIVESDHQHESLTFNVSEANAGSIKNVLVESGIWPLIRQRPYSVIANPNDKPKAIFISGFDSSPLAPDMNFVVEQFPEYFKKGLEVLSNLAPEVHMGVHEKMTHNNLLLNDDSVFIHHFSGPHPSGNISTQINRISPINKGDIIWYCYPQDVITIGRLFSTGKYEPMRLFCLAGSRVRKPQYYMSYIGTQISPMVQDNICEGKNRIISGNVLTGHQIAEDGFVSFYHNAVTVIPEGDYYELFGWIWPGFKKYSLSKTFASSFFSCCSKPSYDLDTNTHGEERPFVVTGLFEKVFPFDIYPLQLIKACIIEDIDLMENLGIYEIDEEDFALCEFVDPSKTEIQKIIRQGINLMKKENE